MRRSITPDPDPVPQLDDLPTEQLGPPGYSEPVCGARPDGGLNLPMSTDALDFGEDLADGLDVGEDLCGARPDGGLNLACGLPAHGPDTIHLYDPIPQTPSADDDTPTETELTQPATD